MTAQYDLWFHPKARRAAAALSPWDDPVARAGISADDGGHANTNPSAQSKIKATVWAVVPAAGISRRFQPGSLNDVDPGSGPAAVKPKQLEPVAGHSMLATVLDALEQSRVAGVVVVVNPTIAAEIQQDRHASPRLAYVVNDRGDSQMIESVQMGFAEVDRVHSERGGTLLGYLICPGDHPCLRWTTINQCVGAFEATPDQMIIASHGGQRGHPLILPAYLARQVSSWPATDRLDTLRTRYPRRVREIEVQDPGVLMDVDTPAEMERAVRLARQQQQQ